MSRNIVEVLTKEMQACHFQPNARGNLLRMIYKRASKDERQLLNNVFIALCNKDMRTILRLIGEDV